MRLSTVLVAIALTLLNLSSRGEADHAIYVKKAKEIVNAQITAASIEHYERARRQSNAGDSIVWGATWVISAKLDVYDVTTYKHLKDLIVVKMQETGTYSLSDGTTRIVHRFDPAQRLWFVGILENGGAYLLGPQSEDFILNERAALRSDLEGITGPHALSELALLFYEIDSARESCVQPTMRAVESFDDVRMFYRWADSIAYSQSIDSAADMKAIAAFMDSTTDELWAFDIDTSSEAHRNAVSAPKISEASGVNTVTLFVANSCDYSVRKIAMRVNSRLECELIASERVF